MITIRLVNFFFPLFYLVISIKNLFVILSIKCRVSKKMFFCFYRFWWIIRNFLGLKKAKASPEILVAIFFLNFRQTRKNISDSGFFNSKKQKSLIFDPDRERLIKRNESVRLVISTSSIWNNNNKKKESLIVWMRGSCLLEGYPAIRWRDMRWPSKNS